MGNLALRSLYVCRDGIFVVITGFKDNDNMMIVVELMVAFMVNFACACFWLKF